MKPDYEIELNILKDIQELDIFLMKKVLIII